MSRTLALIVLTATLVPLAALAQEPAIAAPATEPDLVVLVGCGRWAKDGLPDGPVALGYFEGDMATGRRACPRTEAGLGGRFGAIIDTPDFYGALGVNGLVFGSWAWRRDTELFATLEAVNYSYAQNAVLTSTRMTLGNLTAGATHVLYEHRRFVGSLSGRLLLPTSFEIPGARLVGAEVGHSSSWHALDWLEVHSYVGVDFTGALSRAASYTRVGGVALLGAQLVPTSWFAFVLDVSGRAGAVTYLAPTVGLRFRAWKLGIELGATLPLIGSDRHDFIMGGRFSWRLD